MSFITYCDKTYTEPEGGNTMKHKEFFTRKEGW